MKGQDDPVQGQIHQDLVNPEYIEVITTTSRKSFYMACRSRLTTMNDKLKALEWRIEDIEAHVMKGETLT